MFDLEVGDGRIPTEYPCPHNGCNKKLTMLVAADPPVLACNGPRHAPHESPLSYEERLVQERRFRKIASVSREFSAPLADPLADWFEQLADWVMPQAVSEAA